MDAPAKQPRGWDPDPWAPGAMRRWDGERWGADAPVAPCESGGAKTGDGLALAGLIVVVSAGA